MLQLCCSFLYSNINLTFAEKDERTLSNEASSDEDEAKGYQALACMLACGVKDVQSFQLSFV